MHYVYNLYGYTMTCSTLTIFATLSLKTIVAQAYPVIERSTIEACCPTFLTHLAIRIGHVTFRDAGGILQISLATDASVPSLASIPATGLGATSPGCPGVPVTLIYTYCAITVHSTRSNGQQEHRQQAVGGHLATTCDGGAAQRLRGFTWTVRTLIRVCHGGVCYLQFSPTLRNLDDCTLRHSNSSV